jgi:hypothetical protein
MLIESLKMIPLAGMSATCLRSSAARATNAFESIIGPGPTEEERKGRASPASSFMEALACRPRVALGLLALALVLTLGFLDGPGRKSWRTAYVLLMWVPYIE